MGIYGHRFDSLLESQIPLADQEIKDTLLEMYINQEEFEDILNFVEEGANTDIMDIWFDSKRDIKDIKKQYKDALKANNFKKAYEAVDKLEKLLKDNKSEMEKVPADSWTTNIIGNLAALLLTSVEVIVIPSFGKSLAKTITIGGVWNGSYIGAIGGGLMFKAIQGAQVISALIILYRDIKKSVEEFKKSDTSDAKALNMFRNKFLRYMDDYIKNIDRLRKEIKRAEVKYGNTDIGQLKKKIEELENNKK